MGSIFQGIKSNEDDLLALFKKHRSATLFVVIRRFNNLSDKNTFGIKLAPEDGGQVYSCLGDVRPFLPDVTLAKLRDMDYTAMPHITIIRHGQEIADLSAREIVIFYRCGKNERQTLEHKFCPR